MKILDAITGRARLVIEYMLIGLVVALGAWALWARGDLARQNTQIVELRGASERQGATIKSLADVNKVQDDAIAKLRELRERDARQIIGLQSDLTHADVRSDSMRAKVEALEKNNARARDLLDLDVPDDVGCVLDDRPCTGAGRPDEGRARDTQPGATSTLRGGAPGAHPQGP